MATAASLSVVVQGPFLPETLAALRSYRASVPDAELVLSVWQHDAAAIDRSVNGLIDKIVLCADPGPLPSTVRSSLAKPNNVNRMLVSSRNGIAAATRPVVLRVRSDAMLSPGKALSLWQHYGGASERRLLILSRYTRHPWGLNGYLFHLSDWLTLGWREDCLAFWSAPLMPMEDAMAFALRAAPSRRPNVRRWRARLSQEQWVTVHWAAEKGYRVVRWLAEENANLRRAFLDLLAREVIVVDPERIDFTLPAHSKALRSWFQRVDCLSERDWLQVKQTGHLPVGWRAPFFLFRDVVLRGSLTRKAIRNARERWSSGKRLARRHDAEHCCTDGGGWQPVRQGGVRGTETADPGARRADDQASDRESPAARPASLHLCRPTCA